MACPGSKVVFPSTDAHPFLLNLIKTQISCLESNDVIHDAGHAIVSIIPSRPSTAIRFAHQQLHIYPFKHVPLCWRRVYEEGCLWQIIRILETLPSSLRARVSNEENESSYTTGSQPDVRLVSEDQCDTLQYMVRLCDMALILTGALQRRELFDKILAFIDPYREPPSIKTQSIFPDSASDSDSDTGSCTDNSDVLESVSPMHPSKRRRLNTSPPLFKGETLNTHGDSTEFTSLSHSSSLPLNYPLARMSRPSWYAFHEHVHKHSTPVILTGTIDHWSALHRWRDPRYWLKRTHGGRRLVPVEIGKNYTDQGWGQKIMTFGRFLNDHLGTSSNQVPKNPTGYLAQHDLLTQIPAFRNDISIPDYCYIDTPLSPATTTNQNVEDSEASDDVTEPLLNLWLGPAHTISPAHTDPHHNILAQVFGRKYIRLFAPSETEKMYPMSRGKDSIEDDATDINSGSTAADTSTYTDIDMTNTSRVDVGAFVNGSGGEHVIMDYRSSRTKKLEQEVLFPRFKEAKYVEGILEAGECLYIPRGWWHYVESLEVGCSVSFWWD